jgi:hypothetical protein
VQENGRIKFIVPDFPAQNIKVAYLGFLLYICNNLLEAYRVISWFVNPSYVLALFSLCGLSISLT